MFHNIPEQILERMHYLETLDELHRREDFPKEQRLRQIPPETGRFLALLAASAPPGLRVEVGASGGYSGLWLSLACRLRGERLTTFEVLPEKARLAEETFRLADVDDVVELVQGNAMDYLANLRRVAFCFMDAEKDVYWRGYDLLLQELVTGGLFVADNVLSHQEELAEFLEYVNQDMRVDAVSVPIGKGVLVCRKI